MQTAELLRKVRRLEIRSRHLVSDLFAGIAESVFKGRGIEFDVRAGEVHCHRLTPARLRRLTSPLLLEHLRSEFHLLRSPQFFSLFRRR